MRTEPGQGVPAYVGQVLVGLVMLILAGSGVLKLLDLSEFADAVGTWELVPSAMAPVIVVVIPTVEVLIGGLWLFGVARGRCVAAAAIMIGGLSAAYIYHLASGINPNCGCVGLLAKFEATKRLSELLLWRNGALLATLLVGAIGIRSGTIGPKSPHVQVARAPGRAGFTLIETVLVVLLTGILLSLVFPMIADVRLSARSIRSNSNMRQHAAIFAAYNVDFADMMPYATDPKADFTVLQAGTYRMLAVYFQLVNRWNIALADYAYDSDHLRSDFYFPSRGPTEWTTYNYSQVFLAAPEYWRDTTRTGPAQWRATHASEVVFPSAKALLVDSTSERIRRRDPTRVSGSPVGVAFVDGSVRNVPLSDFIPGYHKATGWEWHGCFNSVLSRGMHTIDGVRGTDVQP